MSEGNDKQKPGAERRPDQGFTPQRDRRMILFSCLTLIVMSLVIFLMVRNRLVELADVTGAYAQVSFTAADTIRAEAAEIAADELVRDPKQHLAQWLTAVGTVAMVHDKKGELINWDNPNPALGSVYWLDCGLPVTAVKPLEPVCETGGDIRFWGQIALTDVEKLEFSDDIRQQVIARFNLEPGKQIAIFFASEIEQDGRLSPLGEEVDETGQLEHEMGN